MSKKEISNSRNNLKYIRDTIAKLDELLKTQPVKEPPVREKTPKETPAKEENKRKYMYFAGCRTEEDVTKRYRDLMKVFHPDISQNCDEISKIINEERERVLKELRRSI